MSEVKENAPSVAIVGLAARFPGAGDAFRFWENLRDGVEAISAPTDEELRAAGIDPDDPAGAADPRYVRAKGVLAGADRFDAAFFGFTPREAEVMDPQHRVFLESAWEALEDAGCDPARCRGRIGVWAGSGASSYLIANLLPASERLRSLGELQVLLLNDRDFLATRASYALDLKGPSVAVQTACSTSLVAVHMACQALLAGECELALAGGVSVSVPLAAGYLYEPGGILSPDGHCRAFDAAAAGSVEGNGCGVVVLKPLSDAVEDGDRVYAVVRGSAVNNDGAAKVGFTAPSVEGQAEVIAESLLVADVPPDTIGYVEAHGSGTPLGDPIEMAALTQAFRAAGAQGRGFCAVGSVKTAIGHCNAAAGVAGLIKTALALTHRTLPPSLHFATPNPQIDFAGSPFYVPTRAAPWEAGAAPRRAGVSSFGLGGTNVHLVLEEAPESAPGDRPSRPLQLLVLSARTPAALDAAARRLADHLEAHPETAADLDATALADAAWTLQTGRKELEHRRIAVARDRRDAAAALRDPLRAVAGRREAASAPPLVFLFPGLGDQRVDMARELYETEPVFRGEVDRAAAALAPLLGADLREVMFSPAPAPVRAPAGSGPDLRTLLRRSSGQGAAVEESAGEARLQRTLFAQPACFVVEHALGRLLMSWGIVPQALIGYSVGEYVAACLAGSLALDDALMLVAQRARRIEELPGGAMLAVPLPADEVEGLLGDADGDLSLAATNGPHFSVVAGPLAAVDGLEQGLAGRGVACLRLRTTHAFHSSMMEPAVPAVAEIARTMGAHGDGSMRPPRIPWISNLTGTWVTGEDLADPGYWARHMRSTVRFAEGLGELLREPDRVFVEVGPGATLGTLVKQHPGSAAGSGGADRITVPTLGRMEDGGSDLEALVTAVGRLWIAGVEVDWERFHTGARRERRRRTTLPTYPFERQRYWIDPPATLAGAPLAKVEPAPPAADLADWFWVPVWKRVPIAASVPREANGRLERWLVFVDEESLGERIAARLRALGHEVSTVAAGPGFAELGDGDFAIDAARRADYEALVKRLRGEDGELPEKVLHLWGVTTSELSFEASQSAGLVSLTLLAQAIAGAGAGTPIRLAMVATGLAQVLDGDPVHPGKATVLGALKVVHQELPRLAAGSVDVLLPPAAGGDERRLLCDQILAEMTDAAAPLSPLAPSVAFRGRQRFVRGFEPVRLGAGDPRYAAEAGLVPRGVYLIAGAADGPGIHLADHLVRRLDAKVGLIFPSAFPPRERWESWQAPPDLPAGHDAIGAAVRRLLELERACGLERVLILRSDDPGAVGAALAELRARFGPLSGAIWTGGAFPGGLLQLKTPESLHAALDSLARGAEAFLAALAAVTAVAARESEPRPAPFILLSSTTTALTGGVGQLELAAAGSYLEALAISRQPGTAAETGGSSTVAVHWDPYQWESWLAAGVAGGMTNLSAEEVQAGLRAHGVAAERSAAALDRLLAGLPGTPAVAVVARDLPGLIAEVDGVTAETLLAQIAAGHGETVGRPALRNAYEPPRDDLEERIAAIWQDLFGIAPIGRDDSFLELGGHSLLAIQIVTRLRDVLAVDLPVTALFEAPTIGQLARSVRQARGETDADELEALLALVEGLSPEEAAARLAEL